MNKTKILNKAKNTKYKHKDWYRGTNRSVYSVMQDMASTGDFYLDFPKTLNQISQLNKLNYRGVHTRPAVFKWLLDTKQYDKLVIRFGGSEGGVDKGKLKIQTFLILKRRFEF